MGLGSCVGEASALLHIESRNIAINSISPGMVEELDIGKWRQKAAGKNKHWVSDCSPLLPRMYFSGLLAGLQQL